MIHCTWLTSEEIGKRLPKTANPSPSWLLEKVPDCWIFFHPKCFSGFLIWNCILHDIARHKYLLNSVYIFSMRDEVSLAVHVKRIFNCYSI